jgi:4-hydroxy-tetrahydrodipicolinate synthase
MTSAFKASELYGVIPALTTPFTPRGTIDDTLFRAQVRFFIRQGVHGITIGGSTGEGHTLSTAELHHLVGLAAEETQGRVPIVAGNIADSARQAVERGRAVADLGVVALMTTPVHYLFRPTEDALTAYFRTLSEEVGLPVIIYNVIPWCYCSPALLDRIFREVPGVVGVKQSGGDLKLLADLLLMGREGKRIFSAVDALLYPSFALGAHGTIAALPAAAPKQTVELWDAVKAGDHARALDIHKRLLRLWNAIDGPNLPACVKYALTVQGCDCGRPRAPMSPPSTAQKRATEAAVKGL